MGFAFHKELCRTKMDADGISHVFRRRYEIARRNPVLESSGNTFFRALLSRSVPMVICPFGIRNEKAIVKISQLTLTVIHFQ